MSEETSLTVLYGDVVAGEVQTVDEFRERLEDIEANEGRSEIDTAKAIAAFAALDREAPSRHHQLEALRQALGLG